MSCRLSLYGVFHQGREGRGERKQGWGGEAEVQKGRGLEREKERYRREAEIQRQRETGGREKGKEQEGIGRVPPFKGMGHKTCAWRPQSTQG